MSGKVPTFRSCARPRARGIPSKDGAFQPDFLNKYEAACGTAEIGTEGAGTVVTSNPHGFMTDATAKGD